MKTKLISIIVGIILIVGIGSLVYLNKKQITIPADNSTNVATPTQTTTPVSSGITLAQIAEHNSSSSCWSAVNGNVYDLTSWIPNHPGGEQTILYHVWQRRFK